MKMNWGRSVLAITLALLSVAIASKQSSKQPELLQYAKNYDLTEVTAHTGHHIFALRHGLESYPETASVSLSIAGQQYTIELSKQSGLFSPTYAEYRVVLDEHGVEQQIARKNVEDSSIHCHYAGEAHADGSDVPYRVVAHLCNGGLTGVVHLENQRFWVEPAAGHPVPAAKLAAHQANIKLSRVGSSMTHVVVDLEELETPQYTCGVGADEHGHEHAMSMSPLEAIKSSKLARADSSSSSSSSHGKARKQAVTKYIEMLVVNDIRRFNALGDNTEVHAVSLVNQVNDVYMRNALNPNLQVVLVGQVTFTNSDPFKMPYGCNGNCRADEITTADLLSTFRQWRVTNMTRLPAHDVAHLFSYYDFSGSTVGLAYVGTLCFGDYTVGIEQTTLPTDTYNAVTIAHELGHNLNCSHDGEASWTSSCSSTGFVMSAIVNIYSAPTTTMSTCTKKSINCFVDRTNAGCDNRVGINSVCLNNVPTRNITGPVCGNGLVEGNEQCDCGAANCTAVGDPCCNGATCRLNVGAVCSNKRPCCRNCQLIPAAEKKLCRASSGACDVADYCDGTTAMCTDLKTGSGTACSTTTGSYAGACYDGNCVSYAAQCAVFSQPGSVYSSASWDQLSQYGVNLCQELDCVNSQGSMRWFYSDDTRTSRVRAADGTICAYDGKQQCKQGQCVQTAAINTAYEYKYGDWKNCFACTEQQTRPYNCVVTGTNTIVDVKLCSLNLVVDQRICYNTTIGCSGDETRTDGINIFGYKLSKTVAIGAGVGILVGLLLICLGCFYCCKKRTDPFSSNEEMATDMDRKRKQTEQFAQAGSAHARTARANRPTAVELAHQQQQHHHQPDHAMQPRGSMAVQSQPVHLAPSQMGHYAQQQHYVQQQQQQQQQQLQHHHLQQQSVSLHQIALSPQQAAHQPAALSVNPHSQPGTYKQPQLEDIEI